MARIKQYLFLLALLGILTGCQTAIVQEAKGVVSKIRPSREKAEGKFIDSAIVSGVLARKTEQKTKLDGFLDKFADQDKTIRTRGFRGRVSRFALANELNVIEVRSFSAYTKRILSKLSAAWPGEVPDIEILLTASESFNAISTSDNQIYLSIGTLRGVAGENEYAAILAHELAHILMRHFQRESFFQKIKKSITAARNIANHIRYITSLRLSSRQDKVNLKVEDRRDFEKTLMKNAAYAQVVLNFSDNIFNPAWTREQEDQADLLGLDLLVAAGYSPRDAIYALERLEDYELQRGKRLKEYTKQQTKEFERLAQRADLTRLVNLAQKSFNESLKIFVSDVLDALQQNHKITAKRQQTLKSYIRREYLKERRRRSKQGTFENKLLGGASGRKFVNYRKANDAFEALANSRVREARSLALQSISSPTSGALYPRTAMYLVRRYSGERGKALGNLERISSWKYAPLVTYDYMILESIGRKKIGQAQKFINEGEAKFGEDVMLPHRISIAVLQEKVEVAKEHYESCESTQQKFLIRQCRSSLGRYSGEVRRASKQEGSFDFLQKLVPQGLKDSTRNFFKDN